MWLLVESSQAPGVAVSAVPLNVGELVVGSSAKCGLVLGGDSVSRRHLAIERTDRGVFFRDLGSTAGSFLNGKQVETAELVPGDELGVGSAILRYVRNLPDMRQRPAARFQQATLPPKPITAGPLALLKPGLKPSAGGTTNWQPFQAFIDTLRGAGQPQELLARLLLGLIELLRGERGYVLLSDRPGAKLKPVASHSIADTDNFVSVSSTVYRHALETGKTVYIQDSTAHSLSAGAASLMLAKTSRSIICRALALKGRVYGVIYLDMPRRKRPPTNEQMQLVNTITGLASEFLAASETSRRLLEAESRIESLSRLSSQEDDFVFGDSPASRELARAIEAAAPQDVSILVTGETGTGKEMVARAIHRASARSRGPFVPVNCAALPRDLIEAELFGVEKGAFTGADRLRTGRFELALGGTIFLDEVGELPLDMQVKLLRVLQQKSLRRLGANDEIPLDFRLVCATNADLEDAVREGTFRQDLYFRINVFRINLEPLRTRKEDVVPLAIHFLKLFSRRFNKSVQSFESDAEQLLESHDWPGNVRELRNAVERAVVIEMEPKVQMDSLPFLGRASSARTAEGSTPAASEDFMDKLPSAYKEARQAFERLFFERALGRNGGNVSASSREVGLSRYAFYRRLAKVGLHAKESADE